MVKQKLHRENYEQVLFKNSKHTFNTHSRTFSSASKLYSESMISNLKKNLSNTKYYECKGKLQRDLSIATDLCILRNFYKNNRDRISIITPKATVLNDNNTDMNPVIGFVENGCGDSVVDLKKNTHLNIDLTSLVVENLKNLLNCWIRKYLLDKNETKEKVESVLDSILHSLEAKSNSTSCFSYAVDIKVVDRNDLMDVIYNGKKTSNDDIASTTSVFSIPLCGSRFRLISTLSMPKHWLEHSINKSKKANYKTKLNSKGINKVNRSIMNLVGVSTNTLIKRCANYKKNEFRGENQCVSRNGNSSEAKEIHENINNKVDTQLKTQGVNDSPDVYDGLYSHNYNVTNVKNIVEKPNKKNFIRVDSQQPVSGLCEKRWSYKNTRVINRCTTKKTYSKVKRKKNKVKYGTYTCINSKYTLSKKRKLFKHFENIFKCISYFEEISNIKLDISVNISPKPEGHISQFKKYVDKNIAPGDEKDSNKTQEEAAQSNFITNLNINKSQQLLNFTTEKDKYNPNIITLLDCNINKSQQLLNFTNSQNKINPNIIPFLDTTLSKEKHSINQSTITDPCDKYVKNFVNADIICAGNGAQIAREINELKIIVRKLADTAKKFLSEHLIATLDYDNVNKEMYNKMKLNQENEIQVSVTEINGPEPTNEKGSKYTQITTSLPKSKVISGIKLKKSPKKNAKAIDPRLLKKSSSYRLFESETVLRITDMTSARNSIGDNVTDEHSGCSLQKCKTTETVGQNGGKLYAYYCDSIQPKYELGHHYIPCQCSSKCFFTNIGPSPMKYDKVKRSYAAMVHQDKGDQDYTELYHNNHNKYRGVWKKIIIFSLIVLPILVVCIVICIFYIGDVFNFKTATRKFLNFFQTNSSPSPSLTLKELGF